MDVSKKIDSMLAEARKTGDKDLAKRAFMAKALVQLKEKANAKK